MSGSLKKMGGNPALAKAAAAWPGVRPLAELSKLHLSLYIALSALTGHVMAQDHFSRDSLVLGGWVLLLACGSGVLNNIQDRRYDRLFSRTRHRLLARNAFPLNASGWVAAGMIITALEGLYSGYGSVLPAALGAVAIVCYNGLYTPLKKTSLWAMVPGTVCGMIPPALGWCAVPEEFASPDGSGLFLVMLALGVWQLPHRMLVELKQPENAIQTSRFSAVWPGRELTCQVLIWTVLFSLAMVLLLVRGWITTPWISGFLWAVALSLTPVLAGLLFYPACRPSRSNKLTELGFMALNLSMFLFLAFIVLDRL